MRLASTGAQSRRGGSPGSVFGLRTEQLRYPVGDPEGGNLRSHQRLLPVWQEVTGPRSCMPHPCKVGVLAAAEGARMQQW